MLLTGFDSMVVRSGDWFLVPNDLRATRHGWTPEPFPVAFHAQPKHPGQAPYGIYVLSSAQVRGQGPDNFKSNAKHRPPFDGEWGVLSWQAEDDRIGWVPAQRIREGSNLLNFFITFEERFKQGV